MGGTGVGVACRRVQCAHIARMVMFLSLVHYPIEHIQLLSTIPDTNGPSRGLDNSAHQRRKKALTADTPTQDPGTVWPRRLLYASFQVAGCADPPARQQRSRSEESSLVALHRTCRRTARQSAVLCCVGEVPATPASAILSIRIDLLQRRSFSKSIYESSAGRSAHTSRDALTAAHLFDARRALPRHSCQGPQGRGSGRTSGMK